VKKVFRPPFAALTEAVPKPTASTFPSASTLTACGSLDAYAVPVADSDRFLATPPGSWPVT
jgi:hypothetical protein